MNDYESFLATKSQVTQPVGFEPGDLHPSLFPFQRDIVTWALRQGRCAIFADTGLGKTRMQLEWARQVSARVGRVLILAPLAVAAQTAREGAALGTPVALCREASDVGPGISITNYDRLHRFDPSLFQGIVLDESSCIKHHDTKTLAVLLESFRHTPFRLAATATPAPNDFAELGTHAEFLGICTRTEMLSEYFVHDASDTQTWRLKGHARQTFWRWVASWGALIRKPSDLGYKDAGYALPPLSVEHHVAPTDTDTLRNMGVLFAEQARDLTERRNARKASVKKRVQLAVELIDSHNREAGNGQTRVHASLSTGQSGEVEVDARNESEAQRGAPKKIRVRSKVSSRTGGNGACIQQGEAAYETPPAFEQVRDGAVGLRRHAGNPEWPVRDMRALGSEQPEVLSGGGPLPRVGDGPGIALHELQPGTWEIQGRAGSAVHCGDVPTKKKWLVWCDYNDEQDQVERELKKRGISCVSIQGKTDLDLRESLEAEWREGDAQVMVTKPVCFGFGLNWQHCHSVIFVGVSDSWESYYQAVRRCYRFGQKRPVNVHIFSSEAEGSVIENLKRKEADAKRMADELSVETCEALRSNVLRRARRHNPYTPEAALALPSWLRSAHG